MFRTSPVHLQDHFLQAVFADLVCGTVYMADVLIINIIIGA